MWTDSHCHLQDARLDGARAPLLRVCRERGIRRWVVNATREADWSSVRALSCDTEGALPAFGLHPWWIRERSHGWEGRLRELLLELPHASLGETGLDLWMHEPDLESQKQVLHTHLHLARELHRPVSLHCLKAWPVLLHLIQSSPPLPAGFLLHSFAGPAEQIREWVRLGARFSFSPAFLSPRRAATRALYAQHIPLSRILVETDCPDMGPPAELSLATVPSCAKSDGDAQARPLNHPLNLLLCADWLCESRGLSQETLQSILEENFKQLFGFSQERPTETDTLC